MSDLYKKTYRGYLIDHHSPDPPIVTLDKLDEDEYERFFKEANINNLMLYCKDHWGVTYYKSAVGKMHPGLKYDWIAKLKPILKRNNIEFTAYYCLEYDNYAPLVHPEWAILEADGTPLRCKGRMAKWRMPCYETGYRQYALTQLGEIVENYRPDSLFLDIFGKSLCYCPTCRRMFKDRYGYELPEQEEQLTKAYKDVVEFLDDSAKRMLKDIIYKVKSIDPKIKVTINFAALYNKEIRDMLDYQFTEPWAGNWLSAAYARDTAIGQYPQLGPGDVSEVYNYQPESVYVLAAAEIAAQGCRVFMYSGSQHPDGTLEHEEARRIGIAYREVQKFEKYLEDRNVIADIGIIQSDTSSNIKTNSSVVANSIGRLRANSLHREALLGAMKLCDHTKYAWNVIPEQTVTSESIKNYKMLLLPNVYHISAELKKTLEEFAAAGGTIVAAGETGLYDADGGRKSDFELGGLFGCSFVDTVDKYKDSAWGSYLDLSESALWKGLPKSYPPVDSIRYKVKLNSGEVVATFIEPATELTQEKWVNWWCPPPSCPTGDPAVIINIVGKGHIVYTAFDIFSMENKRFNWLKGFFRNLVEAYVNPPSVKLETAYSSVIGIVSYDRPKYSEIIVHEISHMAEISKGDTLEINGGIFKVSSAFRKVKSAELVYPEYRELEVCEVPGGVSVKLPYVSTHQVVRLKY